MLKDTVKPVVTGFKLLASETKWVFIRGFRRWEIRQMEKRLAEVKKKFPKAQLVDADSVRVIFLTADAPNLYSSTLMADASTAPAMRGYTRQELFAGLMKPVKRVLG